MDHGGRFGGGLGSGLVMKLVACGYCGGSHEEGSGTLATHLDRAKRRTTMRPDVDKVFCGWCSQEHNPGTKRARYHAQRHRDTNGGHQKDHKPRPLNLRCKFCPGTHVVGSPDDLACKERDRYGDAEFDRHVEMGKVIVRGIRQRRIERGLPIDENDL